MLRSCPRERSKHWSDYPHGRGLHSRWRGPHDSRIQPEPVGRCSAGFGAFKLGCHRGGYGAGSSLAHRGRVSAAGAGAALPARGERVCGRQLRHHGPVHLRQRQREPRHATGLPRFELQLAPIPANVALVIANTMVKHSVAGGDYPTRRAESEAACAVINSHRGHVPFCATRRSRIWINGATRWRPNPCCARAM